MSESYCFMTTEKVKSLDALNRKMNHNFRITDVPNADRERSKQNEEVIPLQDKDYVSAFKRKMIEANHIPRKNAVLAIEVMLTYNARTVGKDFDKEQWKKENVKWLQDTFGKENVISAILHNDEGIEGSGHIHAIIIPMYNGRLSARHYISGKAKMIELQNSYGKAMAKVGLVRGMQGSVAKHQTIRKFYDAANKAISKELPAVKENESAREYRDRANEVYVESNLKHLDEIRKMERKIVEAQTKAKRISLDDRLEYQNEVEKLNKEKERFSKERKKIEDERRKLERDKELYNNISSEAKKEINEIKNFELLIDGLKNYPDREFAKSVGENINTIVGWENNHREKERDNGIIKENMKEK